MRSSLLLSLAITPRITQILVVRILAQAPLGILVTKRMASRSITQSKESFIISERGLRKLRPKLLRPLPLITPVDPNNSLRSWSVGAAQQHCFVPGFNGFNGFEWRGNYLHC